MAGDGILQLLPQGLLIVDLSNVIMVAIISLLCMGFFFVEVALICEGRKKAHPIQVLYPLTFHS